MRVPFIVGVAVLLALILSLIQQIRRWPGPPQWGKPPVWNKRIRIAVVANQPTVVRFQIVLGSVEDPDREIYAGDNFFQEQPYGLPNAKVVVPYEAAGLVGGAQVLVDALRGAGANSDGKGAVPVPDQARDGQ